MCKWVNAKHQQQSIPIHNTIRVHCKVVHRLFNVKTLECLITKYLYLSLIVVRKRPMSLTNNQPELPLAPDSVCIVRYK